MSCCEVWEDQEDRGGFTRATVSLKEPRSRLGDVCSLSGLSEMQLIPEKAVHLGAIGIEMALSPWEWMRSSRTVKREDAALNPAVCDSLGRGQKQPWRRWRP